jgi:serine/threonine protein kinase
MHGDLYGHNILVDTNGHAFLGDFGAASFVPSDASSDTAQAIERLEVRAFGCLLEELVAHCVASPESDGVLQALQQLANDCMQHTPLLRPLFTQILQRLQEVSAA